MSYKILNEPNLEICPKNMKAGQYGVIVKWPHKSMIGLLLYRTAAGQFEILGESEPNGWTNSKAFDDESSERFLVKILPTGTKIEITV